MTTPCSPYLSNHFVRFEQALTEDREENSLASFQDAYKRYKGEDFPAKEDLLVLCDKFDLFLEKFPINDKVLLQKRTEIAEQLLESLKAFSEDSIITKKRIDYLRMLAKHELIQGKDLNASFPYYAQILRLSFGKFDQESRDSFNESYTLFLTNQLHQLKKRFADACNQMNPVQVYEECLATIEAFEQQQLESSFIKTLYETALHCLPSPSPLFPKVELNRLSDALAQKIVTLKSPPIPSLDSPSAIEILWKDLQNYRAEFEKAFEIFEKNGKKDPQAVRAFQKERFKAFQIFFQKILLKSPFFTFFSYPPKPYVQGEVIRDSQGRYDIRAVGSTGKEELTPYSDLELFILVRKEADKIHFIQLADALEKTCHLFCEGTPPSIPGIVSTDFSPKGLYFDKPSHPFFISFPVEMVEFQKNCEREIKGYSVLLFLLSSADLQRDDSDLFDKIAELQKEYEYEKEVENLFSSLRSSTNLQKGEVDSLHAELQEKCQKKVKEYLDLLSFLKSSCLQSGDPDLLIDYQKALNEKVDLKELSIALLKFRLVSYYKISYKTSAQSLKNDYIQLFNYTLHDLALYHQISASNPLDIIDALTTIGEWTEETGVILKKMVSALYLLRVKLHLYYKNAKDEVSFDSHLSLYVLSFEEKTLLKRLSTKVLPCLYKRLKEALTNPKPLFFKGLDLIEENFFFEEIETLEEMKEFIEWCLLSEMTKENHRQLYKALSSSKEQIDKKEFLRKVYIDTLKDCSLENLSLELALIPNIRGERQIRRLNEISFRNHLFAITTTDIPLDEIKVQVTSSYFQEIRYLKQEVCKSIIDPVTKRIQRKRQNSNHSVCRLEWKEHDLHFKDRPDHPSIEYAVYSLTSKIAPRAIPPSELVKFTLLSHPEVPSYPVLISETIPGLTLDEAFKQNLSLQNLNQEQLSRFLIALILTIPLDGRPANYIFNEKTGEIFCIDNDASFGDPRNSERIFSSILFLLDEISQISAEAAAEFLTLDPTLLLDRWFEELLLQERKYEALFTEEEKQQLWEATVTIPKLLRNTQEANPATLSALFPPGAITRLTLQFHHLRDLFENSFLPTPQDLLKTLISIRTDLAGKEGVGYAIAYQYQTAKNSPKMTERFKKAINAKHEVSLTSSQTTRARLGIFSQGSIAVIKKTYSLSQSIEEFFLLQIQEPNIGQGQTCLIQTAHYKAIEADFSKISKGERQVIVLKAFHQLMNRFEKRGETKPQKIVLRNCAVLNYEKDLLPFLHNDLKVLDLTGSSSQDSFLPLIQEMCFSLEELYLSASPFLKTIKKYSRFSRAATLSPLIFPKLKIFHIARCPQLREIVFQAPYLQELKVNENPQLKILEGEVLLFPKVNIEQSFGVNLNSLKMSTIQGLVSLIKDPKDPNAALKEIVQRGNLLAKETIEILVSLIKDPKIDFDVKRSIAVILGEIGKGESVFAKEAMEILISLVKDPKMDSDTTHSALYALRELTIGRNACAREVMRVLISLITETPTEKSILAKEAMEILISLVKELDSEKRMFAKEAIEVLVCLIKDSEVSSDTKRSVVTALEKIGKGKSSLAKEITEVLISLIKDFEVSSAVALEEIAKRDASEGRMLVKEVIKILISFVKDQEVEFDTKRFVATALEKIIKERYVFAKEIIEALISLIKNPKVSVDIKCSVTASKEIAKEINAFSIEAMEVLVFLIKDYKISADAKCYIAALLTRMAKESYTFAKEAAEALFKNSKINSDIKAVSLEETAKEINAFAVKAIELLVSFIKDPKIDFENKRSAVAILAEIGKGESSSALGIIETLISLVKDPKIDSDAKRSAVAILAEIGKGESSSAMKAIEALVSFVKDPRVDSNTKHKAIEALISFINDPKISFYVKYFVVAALGEIIKEESIFAEKIIATLRFIILKTAQGKDKLANEAMKVLVSLLKSPKVDFTIKHSAAAALGEIGKGESSFAKEAIEVLVSLIKDSKIDSNTKHSAFAILGKIGKGKSLLATEAIEVLVSLVKDSKVDSDTNRSAAATLGEIAKELNKLAMEALISFVKNPEISSGAKHSATTALGEIGKGESSFAIKAIEVLVSFVKDPKIYDYIKNFAVYALREIGKEEGLFAKKAIEALISFTNDPKINFYVKHSVTVNLEEIIKEGSIFAEEIIATLRFIILKTDQEKDKLANEAMKVLVSLLKSPKIDFTIKHSAAAALGEIGKGKSLFANEPIEVLVSLTKDPNVNSNIKRFAINALGENAKEGNTNAVEILVSLIKDSKVDSNIKRFAIAALGKNAKEGNTNAVEILVSLIKDSKVDSNTKRFAIAAQGKNAKEGSTNAVETLVSLIKDSEANSDVKWLAIYTLIAIVKGGGPLAVGTLVSFVKDPKIDSDTKWFVIYALEKIGKEGNSLTKEVIEVLVSHVKERAETLSKEALLREKEREKEVMEMLVSHVKERAETFSEEALQEALLRKKVNELSIQAQNFSKSITRYNRL